MAGRKGGTVRRVPLPEIVLAEQEQNRVGGQADRGRQGVGNGSATGAGRTVFSRERGHTL